MSDPRFLLPATTARCGDDLRSRPERVGVLERHVGWVAGAVVLGPGAGVCIHPRPGHNSPSASLQPRPNTARRRRPFAPSRTQNPQRSPSTTGQTSPAPPQGEVKCRRERTNARHPGLNRRGVLYSVLECGSIGTR